MLSPETMENIKSLQESVEATERGLTAGKDYFLEKTHFADFLKSVREELKGEIVSLETASDGGEKKSTNCRC